MLRTALQGAGVVDMLEVRNETDWADAPMIDQPTRCFRCAGLIINDQEVRRLWRCINCGCRGEGWTVFGTTLGYDQRRERAPQMSGSQTLKYKAGDYNEDDADEF